MSPYTASVVEKNIWSFATLNIYFPGLAIINSRLTVDSSIAMVNDTVGFQVAWDMGTDVSYNLSYGDGANYSWLWQVK